MLTLRTVTAMVSIKQSKIDDGAEALAEQAYSIYCGMVRHTPPLPWSMLTNRERGLLTWVVRFTRLQT